MTLKKSKMASYKIEFCLKKENHLEHKYSVTFVTIVGTTIGRVVLFRLSLRKARNIFDRGENLTFYLAILPKND